MFAIGSTTAVIETRGVLPTDVFAFTKFAEKEIGTSALKSTRQIGASAVVSARIRRFGTFVDVVVAARAFPSSGAEALRAAIRLTFARALVLAVQLRTEIGFATASVVTRRTLTFGQRPIDVEMRALQQTRAVVFTTRESAETRVVQRH